MNGNLQTLYSSLQKNKPEVFGNIAFDEFESDMKDTNNAKSLFNSLQKNYPDNFSQLNFNTFYTDLYGEAKSQPVQHQQWNPEFSWQQNAPNVQTPLRPTEPVEQKQPEIKPLTQEDISNLPKFDETYKPPEQVKSEQNIKQAGEYFQKQQQITDPVKLQFVQTTSKDDNDKQLLSNLYDSIDKHYSERGRLTPVKKMHLFNQEVNQNPDKIKEIANKYWLKINDDGSIGFYPEDLEKYNDIFKRKYNTLLEQEQIKNRDPYIKDIGQRLYSGLNRVAGDINATLGYAGLNLIPGYQEKLVEPAYKVAEEYREKSNRGTESITKAIQEGNYKGAVGEAVLQFFENAPNLAMLAVPAAAGYETAGLLTMGTTTGAGQYYQLKDENIPEYVKILNAVTTGLAEMAGEAATTVPILKNSFSVLKKSGIEEGKKQLAKIYTNEFNRIFSSLYGGVNPVIQEGASEWGTEFAQALTEKLTTNPELEWNEIFNRANDAGIVGGLTGKFISAPQDFASVKNLFSSDKYKNTEFIESPAQTAKEETKQEAANEVNERISQITHEDGTIKKGIDKFDNEYYILKGDPNNKDLANNLIAINNQGERVQVSPDIFEDIQQTNAEETKLEILDQFDQQIDQQLPDQPQTLPIVGEKIEYNGQNYEVKNVTEEHIEASLQDQEGNFLGRFRIPIIEANNFNFIERPAPSKVFPITNIEGIEIGNAIEQPEGGFVIDRDFTTKKEADEVKNYLLEQKEDEGYTENDIVIESQSTDITNQFAPKTFKIRINEPGQETIGTEETSPAQETISDEEFIKNEGINIRKGEKGKLWYAFKGDKVIAQGETEQEAINNSRKILEEKENAEEIRKDEGQVQGTEPIGQESQTESGQYIQQPEEAGAETGKQEETQKEKIVHEMPDGTIMEGPIHEGALPESERVATKEDLTKLQKQSQPSVEEETKPAEEKAVSEKKQTESKLSDLVTKYNKLSEYGKKLKKNKPILEEINKLANENNVQINTDNKGNVNIQETTKKAQDIDQKAKEYFGTTDNILKAGFVTKEGELLDIYKERKRGDHNEELEKALGKLGEGYKSTLNEFVDNGNIRVSPESGDVQIHTKPTEKQIEILKNIINKKKGEILLDLKKGENTYSPNYNEGTSTEKIINDINEFFEAKEVKNNNINYIRETGGIEIFTKPTTEQKETLKKFINENDGKVIIYLPDEKGNTTIASRYKEGTKLLKIFADVNKFFDEGLRPLGNIRFRKKGEPIKFASEKEKKEHHYEIRQTVEQLNTKFKMPGVYVWEDAESLPKRYEGEEYKTAASFYDKERDEIHVISSNNTSVQEAKKSFLHEAVGEKGLPLFLGDKTENVLIGVYNSMGKENISRVEKEYGNDPFMVASEYFSEFAETVEKPPIIQNAIYEIKRIGRNVYGLNYTDQDIQVMMYKTKQHLENRIKIVKGFWDKFQIAFVKESLPVSKFMDIAKKEGIKIDDTTDVMQAIETMKSKAAYTRDEIFKEYVQPLESIVSDIIIDQNQSFESVNDYLQAKDAINRNEKLREKKLDEYSKKLDNQYKKKLNSFKNALSETIPEKKVKKLTEDKSKEFEKEKQDLIDKRKAELENEFLSGWTDRKANKKITEFENEVGKDVTNKLLANVKKLTDKNLELNRDYGLINNEGYNTLLNWYENYVPQRGWGDEYLDVFEYQNDDIGKIMAPLKEAKGRKSKADDPLPYLSNMINTTIISGEKNQIYRTVLNLVIQNQDKLKQHVQLKEYWEAIDENGDKTYYLDKPEGIKSKKVNYRGNNFIPRSQAVDKEVNIIEDGKQYTLVFTDPNVSGSINGNLKAIGPILGTDWTKFRDFMTGSKYGQAVDWVKSQITGQNPEFIVPNIFRDTKFGIKSAYVEKGVKGAAYMIKNIPKAQKILMTDSKNPMLRKFYSNGGIPGWLSRKSVDDFKADFERDVNRLNRLKKIKQGHIQYSYQYLIEARRFENKMIEKFARWSEASTRFATFLTYKDLGATDAQAGRAALNATVNFNQSSTMGPLLGKIWFFYQARMNGAMRYLNLAKTNPRRFALVTAMDIAAGALKAHITYGAGAWIFSKLFRGKDDEDKERKKEKSDYMIANYMNYDLPDGTYLSLPKSHGFSIGSNLGYYAYKYSIGLKTTDEFIKDMEKAISNSLTPIDFTGSATLVPSLPKPWYDVYVNETFGGYPIHRDPFTDKLENITAKSQLYMPGVSETIKSVTDGLYQFGGGKLVEKNVNYNSYQEHQGQPAPKVKNIYDINPSDVEYLLKNQFGGKIKFYMNCYKSLIEPMVKYIGDNAEDKSYLELLKEVPKQDYPIVNRFWRDPKVDSYDNAKWYKTTEDYDRMDYFTNELVEEGFYDEYKTIKSDKELQEKMKSIKSQQERDRETGERIGKLGKQYSLTKKQFEEIEKERDLTKEERDYLKELKGLTDEGIEEQKNIRGEQREQTLNLLDSLNQK